MSQKVECLHLEAICAAVSMTLDSDSLSVHTSIIITSSEFAHK